MKIAQIQITPWDKLYYFDPEDINIAINDRVVIKTIIGVEIGTIKFISNIDEKKLKQIQNNINSDDNKLKENFGIKPILRKATIIDLKKIAPKNDEIKALLYAQKIKEKYKVPMKFIGAHFSFDKSLVTFAFVSDGRVDFRNVVKDLTKYFSKTVRLQQIGIRDEVKIGGDCGHCGKELCCRTHLKKLSSITSDMAEIQQCAHRGSDRISGICGRLMCCLSYEQEGYKYLQKKMPAIGTKVSVDGKRGKVIGHNILKQFVKVKFEAEKGEKNGVILEVDLNRDKK